MSENSVIPEQGDTHEHDHSNIMQHIQDMIGGLLKNAVDKMHKQDVHEHLGGHHAGQADAGEVPAQLGIAEIKNFIIVMQKFIDNVNVMVAKLESGEVGTGDTDDKFLEGYMATADNVLEIAAFSMKDTLTGLSNRYGFENRLILEWNRAVRDKSALGLVIFGLDDDECCEDIKDREVLMKMIARTFEKTIKRSTDFIARWNDSEFAALLPITDEGGASIVAERIRREMENLNIPGITDKGCKTTVSIGICDHAPEPNEKPKEFINKAHEAYLEAKKTGGNSIKFAQ